MCRRADVSGVPPARGSVPVDREPGVGNAGLLSDGPSGTYVCGVQARIRSKGERSDAKGSGEPALSK